MRRYGLKAYLEIGYQTGANFKKIVADEKVSVDPDAKAQAMYEMTSDEFFAQNTQQFDCIFIDGDHSHVQVERDIENALKCLSVNGVIVVHDCLPKNELQQRVPRVSKQWTGDGWKAFMKYRSDEDLFMITVDADCGCGIIMRGKQEAVDVEEQDLTWNNFIKHRSDWMNVVSETHFNTMVPDESEMGQIVFSSVFEKNGNLGAYYNSVMKMLGPNDVGCFLDADAMFTTYGYGKQLYDILAKYPKCGLFVATANRIGCTWQRAGNWKSDDITEHRSFGQEQLEKFYDTVDDVSTKYGTHVLGGFLMMIRKSTWRKLGGFKETGMLGVDNDIHRKAQRLGEKVYLMKGVYLYHWYRGGDRNKKDHIVR